MRGRLTFSRVSELDAGTGTDTQIPDESGRPETEAIGRHSAGRQSFGTSVPRQTTRSPAERIQRGFSYAFAAHRKKVKVSTTR